MHEVNISNKHLHKLDISTEDHSPQGNYVMSGVCLFVYLSVCSSVSK